MRKKGGSSTAASNVSSASKRKLKKR
jgi:hypothetical protein